MDIYGVFCYIIVMVSKDKNPLKNKKIIILVILVLIAGALAFYQFSYKKNHNKVATTSEPEKKINYDPPTQSDKDLVNSNKDSIVKKDETINNNSSNNTTTPSAKKSVKPVITYAGVYGDNVEVGSYVNDVYEDGGSCTATFTLGSNNFTKTVTAVKNVSNMSCPVIQVPKSEFNPTGNWSVKVNYESTTASGASDSKTLEVK